MSGADFNDLTPKQKEEYFTIADWKCSGCEYCHYDKDDMAHPDLSEDHCCFCWDGEAILKTIMGRNADHYDNGMKLCFMINKYPQGKLEVLKHMI